MAKPPQPPKSLSAPLAAVLAWILPGLGHWWIGERRRAIIFFVATAVTFWGGVAVAGVRSAITTNENGLWIAAQVCMGPQALGALSWSKSLAAHERRDASVTYKSPWPSSDIGVVYAGVAGLLNLLIILDVLARVDASRATTAARSPPSRKGGKP